MNALQHLGGWMIATGLLTMTASALADEEEIHVGRNGAGQIVVEVEFTQPLELEASIFPGISGYATGLMGMHSTDSDDPTHDFFQVSTAAYFQFILLAKDPGMEVWNDTGSGFLGVGGTYNIGQAIFDNHPIWNLVTNTPGISYSSYSLTLKLHDVNGIYSDSDPVTLSFTAQIARPQINIVLADPLHATLSWATNTAGWNLQSATSLTATNWDNITNIPSITGTNFSLTFPTTASQMFFRLHLQ